MPIAKILGGGGMYINDREGQFRGGGDKSPLAPPLRNKPCVHGIITLK